MAFVHRKTAEQERYLLVGVLALLFLVALVEFLYATRHARREPSPLCRAPAGLTRRLKLVASGAAIVVVVLLMLAFVGFRLFFRLYRMSSDSLVPEVNRGERVLILRSRYVHVHLQPGDVVAFRREGHTFLRKVVRVGKDNVWVAEKSSEASNSETQVPRGDVIGKMVYRLTSGSGK